MRQQSQRSDEIIVIAFDRKVEDFTAPPEDNSDDGCPHAVCTPDLVIRLQTLCFAPFAAILAGRMAVIPIAR
jgi:hypothetical protein